MSDSPPSSDNSAASPDVVRSTTAPVRKPARRSRRRWLFRALTLAIVAAGFVGCELLLRLCGFGESYALVVPTAAPHGRLTHRLNPSIDRIYFGNRDLLGPEPRGFFKPKPPGTFRVVFMGASTVIGFPYAPEVAFPRQVESLLEAQRPELDVEVLNAGITAINSFEIADMARGIAAAEPDLILIHAGHNEFYGPGGPGSTILPVAPHWIQEPCQLRRLRLGPLVGRFLPAERPTVADPLQALPRLIDMRYAGPEFQQAVDNYRHNLTQTITALRRQGIPVLLSTVACNLRHQGPIHNLWPEGLTTAQVQRAEEALATAKRRTANDAPTSAILILAEVEALVGDSASFQFRLGEALARRGDHAAALQAFQRARDLDGCRFRAPAEFGDVVRNLVREQEDPDLTLLDVETLVTDASRDRIPGEDLFLEHVHYNLKGHRLLAREFARAIVEQHWRAAWRDSSALSDPELDDLIGLQPEDSLAGLSFALQAVQTPPLARGLDVREIQATLESEIERVFLTLPTDRRERFADLSLHDMQEDLARALVQRALLTQELDAAYEHAERLVCRKPWSAEAWLLFAHVASRYGRLAEARVAGREVLCLHPAPTTAASILKELGD